MNQKTRPSLPDDPKCPRLISSLVRLVVPEPDREAFLGDLIEEYETLIRPQWGSTRAAWWLWRQVLGSLIPMLRLRVSKEVPMIRLSRIRSVMIVRLSHEVCDARIGMWASSLAGAAIIPMTIVALLRHESNLGEFALGMALALVIGRLCLMLGWICRHGTLRMESVPWRRRRVEFVSYLASLILLIGGIRALPSLGLNAAGIVLALLLLFALCLGGMALGMLTTIGQAARGRENLPVAEG